MTDRRYTPSTTREILDHLSELDPEQITFEYILSNFVCDTAKAKACLRWALEDRDNEEPTR